MPASFRKLLIFDLNGRRARRLQFLHGSGSRYWFEVRPNLNKTVADRTSRIVEDDVYGFLLGAPPLPIANLVP